MANNLRNGLIAAFAGCVHFFLATELIGYAAAIAYPSWYANLVQDSATLGLVVFGLFTTVPAIAISAAFTAFLLTRLVSDRYVLNGFIAVLTAMFLFTASTVSIGFGVFEALKMTFVMTSVVFVPAWIAHWVLLPLFTFLFGKRAVAPA